MNRRLCIVHANCQGAPLIERLKTCPEFSDRFECRLFTNYVREPIPDDILRRCSLFLYQHLGSHWDDMASASLLSKLPEAAHSLCIPNMFFTGYWPTWSSKPGFDYRCEHLDALVALGLPAEETIILALHTDMATEFDLAARLEKTFAQEHDREAHTPIPYIHIIREHYRDVQLFNTINHPGPMLMNHVATGVLRELGFTPPDENVLNALGDPFPEFEQPINPKVAEAFGLSFGGPKQEYEVYGRKMTFARWVANYVSARQAGVSDFIGYLTGADITA
ncbi:WcbI family polysaccharide biosynthesis putative acetyltransferase [uncultured Pseudodesulfovibrio sp.]|uniref:WcbI family polysaccharide biosynthesis putative acetyltransferase n=1 Tax=uncultured Pseudodesulfovibrio sp. TaxID=2035858 RepID=UPI0029C95166|nr:WcbI family polysaccharide biosynthesis putative acetyltransferase [uncultured Pseudodesulfovibrio sp.]